MKSYSRYLICVASLLVAAFLPAIAGSTTGSYTTSVSGKGVKGETVTATFTFDTTKNQFTNVTLHFNGGVFDGVSESYTKCAKKSWSCTFTVTPAHGDSLVYSINLNKLSQYSGGGNIWNKKVDGVFGYKGSAAVPEGGSKFSYLAPAGLVIFGGIFLAGFRRQRVAS